LRPESMKIFDDLRGQNMVVLESAKQSGRKVVGMYCAYCPQELVLAAGAIPVSLCGTRDEPIADAEKVLPRNLCPLIKSSFGFALTGKCPYFYFSDFVIGETTCDGKKKMFELLGQYKPMHVMHLPQGADRPGALSWWKEELLLLKAKLEEHLGVTISDDDLRAAIKLSNSEQLALKELHELNKTDPAPVSGLDLLTVSFMKDFNVDKSEGIKLIKQLTGEVKEVIRQGGSPFRPGTPRVLLTGCPVGIGSEKVVKLLEESGGSVVCFENCSGYKTLDRPVDEDERRDPLEAVAERSLKIPCSCMTPNEGRLELLGRLIGEYRVDGVVDLTWQACHTYNIEAELVRSYVRDNFDLPYLHLETDYSTSDLQQLKTRVTAFIELLDKRWT